MTKEKEKKNNERVMERKKRQYSLHLLNDDVSDYMIVVTVLVQKLEVSPGEAINLANEAQSKGSVILKTFTSYEKAYELKREIEEGSKLLSSRVSVPCELTLEITTEEMEE